ncbi:MAG: hypothetical protein ABW208_28340 [Pyrinomonadaceae bacterium]
MLVGTLIFFLVLGVVCLTPFIIALAALGKWLEARRERAAAEA